MKKKRIDLPTLQIFVLEGQPKNLFLGPYTNDRVRVKKNYFGYNSNNKVILLFLGLELNISEG